MCYWIFKAVFTVILRLLFKFRVEGVKNIPQKTNFIIVANHASFLDPVAVMVGIPRKIYCIAARNLYKIWWLRWFLRGAGSVPDGSSSDKAVSLLMKNKNVGLFPEGGCTRDGKLKKFRRGAALLALKTGRPIVPCAILGTYESFPRGAKFPKFFIPLKVKIGEPIYLLKEFEDIIDDLYLDEGMFKVRNKIEEMFYAG